MNETKPKIIAIGTLKGGTGKTTVTFNLASKLAEKYKVLLMDVDPQANLTSVVGVNVTGLDYSSIREVFENRDTKPEDVIVESPISGLPNIDIIPSILRLHLTERLLVNSSGRELLLANWFKRNHEYLEKYDYIIFDTNPSISSINQNAFYAADSIILVTDIDENSAMGIDSFCFMWEESRFNLGKEDNVKAIIINNLDKRINLANEMKEYLGERELTLETAIPSAAVFKNANADKTPINIFAPNHKANDVIESVVNELTERGIF